MMILPRIFDTLAALQPADFLLTAALVATAAAVMDLRTRRIPNRFTGPAFLAALLLHLAADGMHGMAVAAAAGLAAGAVFLFFFLAGGMGGGDVKLIAAVCAMAGPVNTVQVLLATAFSGGVLALALAIARGRLGSTLRNVAVLVGHHGTVGLAPHPDLNLHAPKALRLPYALAIAAGCWAVAILTRMA
jgi:prepilin peptidase CpaA